MNFKKYWIVYLILFLVLVALSVSRILPAKQPNSIATTPMPSVNQSVITINIDTESTHYTTTVKGAASVFTALEQAVVQLQLPLQTKQYDFGVLIEKIADAQNSNEKAWIYYLNGKSGEVAADKQKTKLGDVIEWKYIRPN